MPICVFDCETIPDVELLKKVYDYEGEALEVCEKAFNAQKESSGNEFLPHCFHKIVTIAALIVDHDYNMIKIGCFEQGKEEESIVGSFLRYLNSKQPRLVSFNGKFFDMPVILLRALKYNISAFAFFETNNIALNKDKWENYRSRYSERFHLDIFDCLGHFGAAAKGLKLHTLALMNNMPGKYDISGSEVCNLYYAGDMQRIDNYCEADVLNTYWLFLKYEMLCGHIMPESYMQYLRCMQEKIAQKPYADVFHKAIEAEIERIGV